MYRSHHLNLSPCFVSVLLLGDYSLCSLCLPHIQLSDGIGSGLCGQRNASVDAFECFPLENGPLRYNSAGTCLESIL